MDDSRLCRGDRDLNRPHRGRRGRRDPVDAWMATGIGFRVVARSRVGRDGRRRGGVDHPHPPIVSIHEARCVFSMTAEYSWERGPSASAPMTPDRAHRRRYASAASP